MKKICMLLALLSCSSAFSADLGRSTAVSIELDGPVTTHPGVQVGHFTAIDLSSMSYWDRAKALKLLAQVPALTRDFRAIEKGTHGIGNVFYQLAGTIRADYGVNLTDGVASQLVDCFTQPVINVAALAALRKAKEAHGCVVLAATHMDAKHFALWQKKADAAMAEHGDQFDAYVTARFNHLPEEAYQAGDYTKNGAIYMVNAADAVTPKQEVKGYAVKTNAYFDVVQQVSQDVKNSIDHYVHIDPSQACIDVAQGRDNFEGVLFEQSAELESVLAKTLA